MLNGNQKQWEFLKNKYELGQLSHAYIFSGKDQTEKEFSKEFIKFINCTDGKKPCNQCQNCKLVENETFPDLFIVKSINSGSSIKNEKDSMEIDVSQIREINNFLSYKSYYGPDFIADPRSRRDYFKSVIIDNAERMNSEAQSCLLKTLEEPKGRTIIILVASKPEMLISTILSRCQTIKFFPIGKYEESKEEQKTFQELLSVINSPLATRFQYAKRADLQEGNFNKIVEILQRRFRNIMLAKIGVIKEPIEPQFINYSVSKIKKIIRLMEKINHHSSITNASPKLALEILLMEI